jgi:Double zinc ribbon
MVDERRCSSCGALVAPDAGWCGQCYASLEVAPAHAAVGAATERGSALAGEAVARSGGGPAWPCPACGTANPLEIDLCSACGTPFARLFQEPDQGPAVAPRTAALWSMAFPGLGQWRCGRSVDALVRVVAFLFPVGTILILILSRLGRGGLGPASTLFALLLVAGLFVWVTSAVDAHRVASGVAPLVSSRSLLWGLVVLIVVSLAMASAVALPAVRHR